MHSNTRAQGAVEYLLILGAAILVVSIVVVATTGVISSGKATNTGTSGDYNGVLDQLRKSGGTTTISQYAAITFSQAPATTTINATTYFKPASGTTMTFYSPTINDATMDATGSCLGSINNGLTWPLTGTWDSTTRRCSFTTATIVTGGAYTFRTEYKPASAGAYTIQAAYSPILVSDIIGPTVAVTPGVCYVSNTGAGNTAPASYAFSGFAASVTDSGSGISNCSVTLAVPNANTLKNFAPAAGVYAPIATITNYSPTIVDSTTAVSTTTPVPYTVVCTDNLNTASTIASGNISCLYSAPQPYYQVTNFGGSCTSTAYAANASFSANIQAYNVASPNCSITIGFPTLSSAPSITYSGTAPSYFFSATNLGVSYPGYYGTNPTIQANLICGGAQVASTVITCNIGAGTSSSTSTNPLNPLP